MTFQITLITPVTTKAATIGHTSAVSAGIKDATGNTARHTTRARVRPSLASTRGVMAEPRRAPMALAVSTKPNPASERPIGPGSTM